MAKINLTALLQAAKGQQKKPKKGPKMQARSASTISFRTKDGKKVVFRAKGIRKAEREAKMSAYNVYVQENIHKYIPAGGGLRQGRAAMKKVAADWNRLQKQRASRKSRVA